MSIVSISFKNTYKYSMIVDEEKLYLLTKYLDKEKIEYAYSIRQDFDTGIRYWEIECDADLYQIYNKILNKRIIIIEKYDRKCNRYTQSISLYA
jgi:hypothetical protein